MTDAKYSWSGSPAMGELASDIWMLSSSNQFGDNPAFTYQLFRFDPLTGVGSKVTSLRDGVDSRLTCTDDGEWLAFVSRGNLTGTNHDESREIFVMRPDGTGLSQVTSDPGPHPGVVSDPVMSGSGNRIVFMSTSDYLGSNASHLRVLFVVNPDGSGLRQITSGYSVVKNTLGVSDDGERIVFCSNGNPIGQNPSRAYQVFSMRADGSNLHQLTSTTAFSVVMGSISGDGQTVAYSSYGDPLGTNPSGSLAVFVSNWEGTSLRQLTALAPDTEFTSSWATSISTDGSVVYFDSDHAKLNNADGNTEAWWIRSDGTQLFQLTDTTFVQGCINPIASGSGNRIVFWVAGGTLPGWSNPDLGTDAAVTAPDGTQTYPLTDTRADEVKDADLTPDGNWIVFVSNADLTGANPDASEEIFRMHRDGTALSQVTHFIRDSYGTPHITAPSVSDDGSVIAFVYNGDPLNSNPFGLPESFVVQADGTGLRQLSSGNLESGGPVVAGDGSLVVFESLWDMVPGGNPDHSWEIYAVRPDGSGLRQLSPGAEGLDSRQPTVDRSGSWVAFASDSNLDGGNPEYRRIVYRVRTDGSGLERLTSSTGDSDQPDISGLGDRIAFASTTNPTGGNPTGLRELFVFDLGAGTFRQLTSGDGAVQRPRISDDGSHVFFVSSHPYAEPSWSSGLNPYRVASDGSGGVEPMRPSGPCSLRSSTRPIASTMSGDLAVFSGYDNCTDENPDGSGEVWQVDFAAMPALRVSGGRAPTQVSWDFEPGRIRYDAIRGNVKDLRMGAGTIDLGTVYCVEDDSPDADTEGNDDPDMPAPGEAYFYLVRGSLGTNYGPGSWGQGSSGLERVAGVGSCGP